MRVDNSAFLPRGSLLARLPLVSVPAVPARHPGEPAVSLLSTTSAGSFPASDSLQSGLTTQSSEAGVSLLSRGTLETRLVWLVLCRGKSISLSSSTNQTGPLSLVEVLNTLLCNHWSRASLLLLAPAVLCHKEPY